MKLTRREFEEIVVSALKRLPKFFKKKMKNVDVVVEKLGEIADSLAIGQNWEGEQRIILFVKLAQGVSLTKELKDKITKTLREKASPRHVPAIIMEMPDAPYTMNMKKVESAVTNIIDGRPVVNRDALMNPEVLDYFEKIVPELQK